MTPSKKEDEISIDKLREIIDEFVKSEMLYSPNSIYHGSSLHAISKETLLINEVATLTDFIDYLFNHSEHCDHITQVDAFEEFRLYEINEKIKQNNEEQELIGHDIAEKDEDG